MKKKKKIQRAIQLDEGMSVADLIKQLNDMGVTDLTTVTFDHDYVSCCCDDYCYCESAYTDNRFVWEE